MSVTRILWVVFFLNAAVAATKLAFGYSIHSISLVADGFHSTTDAAMNIAGLAAIFIAARPPDANHPYGHKKVETLASLFVGVLLVFVAYQIVQLALDRWSSDTPAGSHERIDDRRGSHDGRQRIRGGFRRTCRAEAAKRFP